jgi:hypothetical protein
MIKHKKARRRAIGGLPKGDLLAGGITSEDTLKAPSPQHFAASWISRRCRLPASTAALVAELALSCDGRAWR